MTVRLLNACNWLLLTEVSHTCQNEGQTKQESVKYGFQGLGTAILRILRTTEIGLKDW